MKASYKDLKVWQYSMQIAVDVYEITDHFPRSEMFGLSQQMRRAAVSVASNIAEGYGRRSPQQRYTFLEQSLGSLFELETQLELASRLNFASQPSFNKLAQQVTLAGRSLSALMRYVESEGGTSRRRKQTSRPPVERE